MPFFTRSTGSPVESAPAPAPTPARAAEEPHRFGIFHRRNSSGASASTTNSYNAPDRQASVASSNSGGRNFLQKLNGGLGSNAIAEMDPSIVGARERVMGAEKAERDADQALAAARVRVREAREEVLKLEREAEEEARRAKLKQRAAHEMSKRGHKLGRHDL